MKKELRIRNRGFYSAHVAVLLLLLSGVSYAADQVKAPEFSVERGFYSSPQSVQLTSGTPGAQIRYTVDGTWPSATHGTLGTTVAVTTTTVVRAIATLDGLADSTISTNTYLYVADILRQPKNAQGSPTPDSDADYINWGSTEMNQTYVNNNLSKVEAGLRALPAICISGDPVQMFGDETRNGMLSSVWDYEIKSSFEVVYPDGREGHQTNCGIRVAGQSSRWRRKKPFTLEFRERYGAKKLNFPLMPSSPVNKFDEIRLRGSWQATYRPYWEQWTSDLQIGMSGDGHHGLFAHLYINGVYWGFYNAVELAKSGYGEEHLGGEKDDYSKLRGHNALMDELVPQMDDLSDPVQYAAAKKLLNIKQYADFVLLYMYLNDRNEGATFIRESRNVANLKAGIPWHPYIWDTEETRQSLEHLDTNPVAWATTNNALFTKLWASPDYKMTFADRVRKHLLDNGTLTPARLRSTFQAKVSQSTNPFYAEISRWRDIGNWWDEGGSEERMGSTVDWNYFNSFKNTLLNDWIPARTGKLLQFLRDANLYPSVEAPSFSRYGGSVSSGYNLQITGSGGTLYYSLDGSDPRLTGAQAGQVSSTAIAGTLPQTVNLTQTTVVKARIKNGSTWSALTESTFLIRQEFAKLKITEIMYHPEPGPDETLPDGTIAPIDGDRYEFIEFKNTGTRALELQGSSFTDGVSHRFDLSAVVPAGGFLVLVSSPKQFEEKYPGVTYHGVYSGSLSNGGENIELSRSNGTVITALNYDDKAPWPLAPDGAGFSMVPTNPNPSGDANDPTLWRTSANLGGSPGADDPEPAPVVAVLINEVLTHTDLPQKDSIELHNPTSEVASIGGWYLTDDNQTPAKFRIPFGTTIAPGGFMTFTEDDFNNDPTNNPNSFGLSSLGEEAYLFSANNDGALTGYSHGFKFDAAQNGVSFGRYTISTGADHYPSQISNSLGSTNIGPKVGPVVINELMYHPLDTADEFVEIKNISNATVKLYDPANPQNTWRLSGVGFDFPQNISIPSGGLILVVGIDPATFRSTYNVPAAVQILGPYLGKLSNGGESVSLKAPEGPTTDSLGNPLVPMYVVDKVKYDDVNPWPTSPDGNGPSLTRKDAQAYGNDPVNWEVGAAGGTPGTDGPPNEAPIAAFSATPTTGAAPLLAQFDASASSDDNGITSYAWDFGDGNNGTGANASNTFASAGDYTVTLIVTDAEGESDSVTQTMTVTTSGPPPGLVTLAARDQFGQDVVDALIYIREKSTWYPVGTQVQLTVGTSYRFRGKISNAQGAESWVKITDTTTEVLVPFWTATLIAKDQLGNDVTGAQIRVRYYFEEFFNSNKSVTLPKGYLAQVYAKVSNTNGPRVYFKFTDGLSEVNPGFRRVTLAARDQFGSNVTNAQIRIRYHFSEWYVAGDAVTTPLGYTAQVYGKVPNVTGPRVYFKFDASLNEIEVAFWRFTVHTRDQFGAVVQDGQAQIRYLNGEYFSDGTALTVPKGDSIQTRSRRKGLYANKYEASVFTDGLDTFEAKFRSVLFKAVATNGTTLVPGAEIELYRSQFARFENNTRKGVPVPDTIHVRVYKDGVLIADLNPATIAETTDTLIIPTSFEAPVGNSDPIIDSNPVADPNPAEMGQTITFHVGATDADNDSLTYTWNFGDGTGSNGTDPTHTYNTVGTYTVNVTVTDGNQGSDSATFDVVVNDSVPPQLTVSTIILKGNVSDDSGIASLKVNGQTVTVQADGSWQKEVTLGSASTTVNIEATDSNGNKTTQAVTVSK